MGTILFQDDVGGLEVESPHGSGNFVAVSPIPGTVVFNIGDFLMRWSNGTILLSGYSSPQGYIICLNQTPLNQHCTACVRPRMMES